jgi:hypothetical protein
VIREYQILKIRHLANGRQKRIDLLQWGVKSLVKPIRSLALPVGLPFSFATFVAPAPIFIEGQTKEK